MSQNNDHLLPLIAFKTGNTTAFTLRKASPNRDWMDSTDVGFAKRCLPLLLANQYGWHITVEQDVECWWSGGNQKSSLRIYADQPADSPIVESHFGYGILTWRIPFLFRTPQGVNLLVRGPANHPLDGISALDGIVETDWSAMTFTMNWKITRRFKRIVFRAGYPICLIVPQPRSLLEQMVPEIRDLEDSQEICNEYRTWARSRVDFNNKIASDSGRDLWQKDYFQGRPGPDGRSIPFHQTKIQLREFKHAKPPSKT